MSDWKIYDPTSAPVDADPQPDLSVWLDDPPPWRRPKTGEVCKQDAPKMDTGAKRRGRTYVSTVQDEVERVNIALLLRRPILVRGRPGLGKSTLAYSLAYHLGLGQPLVWPINSESTLHQGLYHYDALSHLQQMKKDGRTEVAKIEEHISLGPLGTALLPTTKPRVLLIDELDKSNYDLSNDLLHVFEEGEFYIPELRDEEVATVAPYDFDEKKSRIAIHGGHVRTRHHPVVVMTSNDEREFPEPFLRRCVVLEVAPPSPEKLGEIAMLHFADDPKARKLDPQRVTAIMSLVGEPLTDTVLNALYLSQWRNVPTEYAVTVAHGRKTK